MKEVEYIVKSILIIFFIWILFSYLDVIAHNGNPYPKYSNWNVFEILSEVVA